VATTYIDATFRSTILKFTPDGTQSVFGILPAPHFAQDVVIDRYDNVFVMSSHPRFRLSIVFKFTPDGQRIPFATLPKATSLQRTRWARPSTSSPRTEHGAYSLAQKLFPISLPAPADWPLIHPMTYLYLLQASLLPTI
jgi:hypothetical protein